MEYEYIVDHSWVSNKPVPKYDVLKTSKNQITGTVWHKLITNAQATRLISKSKAYTHWEIRVENTGKKFFWVTDKLLTVLHIQGLQKGY